MKRLAGFLILVIVLYAIYNDISMGTLPAATSNEPETIETEKAEKQKEIDIPWFEHEVQPGDTLLSVLDSNSDSPLNVPVTKAVEDFKKLNAGTEPQKIKFGSTYKFPDYSKQN
ncbi:LysM peptidoglycan-binding domain-containing protein [Mesobacillus subterraneus]|uniref:LysM domain-containing protein n=1 Tax=Mesobacillus subterraneus TaxID=285983 RepID=A0A427TSY9_9BACI|nr:LysM domain-containing protein [Mesobacillus subterraneus]RSD27463.1 LysM domain-containing protein [Mesobacillus subterraneus]